MNIQSILKDVKYQGNVKDFDTDFVTDDSRKVRAGCVFVAGKGNSFDGHTFAAKAIELGAKLVLCSSADGQRGWDDQAARLAAEQGGWFADYYADDLNPEFHRRVTGPAILKETEGKLDFVVAAVGSGGTISGVGEYIKAWTNGIRIVAVEPVESQVLSGGFAGPHGLEGIGCGFVPENYNPYIVDQVIPVSTGDGREAARQALLTDGLPLSPAAGAALAAALQLAVMPENAGKRVVAIVGGRSIF